MVGLLAECLPGLRRLPYVGYHMSFWISMLGHGACLLLSSSHSQAHRGGRGWALCCGRSSIWFAGCCFSSMRQLPRHFGVLNAFIGGTLQISDCQARINFPFLFRRSGLFQKPFFQWQPNTWRNGWCLKKTLIGKGSQPLEPIYPIAASVPGQALEAKVA